jgi:hypothetical protein
VGERWWDEWPRGRGKRIAKASTNIAMTSLEQKSVLILVNRLEQYVRDEVQDSKISMTQPANRVSAKHPFFYGGRLAAGVHS